MRTRPSLNELHAGRVSLPATGKLLAVGPREELNRQLVIFAIAAPGAILVWYVFHGVYVSLTESVRAVGYVDASTQTGIDLGYVVMVGGTLALALLALRSGFRIVTLLLRQRRER